MRFMRMLKGKDLGTILFDLFLFGLSAFALIFINSGRQTTFSGAQSFDFTTVPTIWSVVLGVLVLIHLLSTLIAKAIIPIETSTSSQEIEAEKRKQRTIRLRTIFTFIALVVYVALLKKINFLLLSTVFLFAMFYILGQKKLRLNALVSIVGGLFMYLILVVALNLPL